MLRRFLYLSGSLEKALALAARERKRPVTAVHVGQILPPHVTITSPTVGADGIQVKQAQIEVKATARSVGTHPVTAMRLLLDGRPYLGQKGVRTFDKPRQGQVEAVWMVAQPPGKHTLAVQAESAVSKTR